MIIKNKNNSQGIILFSLLFFIVQPFFSFFFIFLYGLYIKRITIDFLYFFIFLGACFLSLINVTKLPESDLLNYIEAYEVAKTMPLTEFLILNTREPLYYSLVYFLSHFLNFDQTFFVFLSTFLPYIVFLLALAKLSYFLKLDLNLTVALIAFIIFFPQLFSISAHILRQFTASSIVIYILVSLQISGKRRPLLALSAFFIHFSSALIIGLSYIKKTRMLTNSLTYFLYLLFFIISIQIIFFISVFLEEIPVIGIIFSRINSLDGASLEAFSILNFIFVGFVLFIAILNLYFEKKNNVNYSWVISNIGIFISVMILIFSVIPGLSELALRFFFYLYFLIAILLPYSISYVKRHKFIRELIPILALLISIAFFYNLENGAWTYSSLIEILSMPSWKFFII